MSRLSAERAAWIEAYVEERRHSDPGRDDYYLEAGSRGWLSGDALARANAHQNRLDKQRARLSRWFGAWKAEDPEALRAFCAARAEASVDRAEYWKRIQREACFASDVFHAFEELVRRPDPGPRPP